MAAPSASANGRYATITVNASRRPARIAAAVAAADDGATTAGGLPRSARLITMVSFG